MSLQELVFCSLEPWDEVWRRNQYFLDGLLRRNPRLRVLLIEPVADPLHAVLTRKLPRPGVGLRKLPGYEGRLYALQTTKWLPRAAGPMADRLLVRAARRSARRVGFRTPTLWVNDPGWAGLLEAGWPALYDITDDWLEADRGPREHERIVAGERRLMERCAVVVVCSRGLQASKSLIRPVELVQNAVDVHAYQQPRQRPHDLPAERVALYAGTMHEDRLDVDLCVEIAEHLARVGGTSVFVGPNALSAANTKRLEQSAGTLILGPRPHREVPAYLQHADVLTVPHRVDHFTESLDPIKLYEYEAVGRPIAATPVAGFRELDGARGVLIASADELPRRLAAALEHPADSVGPFAPVDWSQRVDAIQDILEGLAPRR